MSYKLTEEDIRTAIYFIKEKSIDRWVEWEEKEELFRKEFSELLNILDTLDRLEKLLDFEIEKIQNTEFD